jgi:hypothetical protein
MGTNPANISESELSEILARAGQGFTRAASNAVKTVSSGIGQIYPLSSTATPTSGWSMPWSRNARSSAPWFSNSRTSSAPWFSNSRTSSAPWFSSSGTTSWAESMPSGNYWLKVLYFLLMFSFVIFLVLIFVHLVYKPIFSFTPGSKGIIVIPAQNDNIVYWTNKKTPNPYTFVPQLNDALYTYSFENNFSFCVDLFITQVPNTTSHSRLILYKSNGQSSAIPEPIKATRPQTDLSGSVSTDITIDDFIEHMSNHSSMIMYLTSTNDLTVTFFCGSESTRYSIPYIKNVPLFTPFRISVVVEDKMFNVYLNGKQTFQTIVPGGVRGNTKRYTSLTGNQFFYLAPDWANAPSKSVYLQNFNLWQRPIAYTEVVAAQPALALESDFNVSKDTENVCSS